MNIDQLQKNLRDAENRVKGFKGSLEEHLAAFGAVSEAQRALAAAQGHEYAVPFDIGFVPEAAVSGPVLFQTDYSAVLTFNAMVRVDKAKRTEAGTGVIELVHCKITKFGYPNDEALAGHPLYQRGLSGYGVFEVINSSWSRQLTEQNRVSFPNTPDSSAHHFIFTFHDSTFECIAGSLSASLSNEPFERIVASLSQRVLGEQ